MNNTTSDRITLLESTDGDIKITANDQRIFIVTPFNAEFKDQLKARFGARWNGSTKEWSIAFRYRDDLDPLLYNHFGVSMIADVTTPSLMKVAIDAQRLYQVSGAGAEINLAGSRVAVRWGRDEAAKVYRGFFTKDGEDFCFPRSGGSMRRPRVAGCGELDGAVLETEITPAELDWLRENEIHFELLDGGESAEPEPEDPQLDPEDMDSIHEDDDAWDVDEDDEDRVYVHQEEEEETEAEAEVKNETDEVKEEPEMKTYHVKADGSMGVCKAKDGNCPFGEGTKHFTNESEAQAYAEKIIKDTTDQGGMKMKKQNAGKDFMSIEPVTMDDRRAMEMKEEEKMNADRVAETKSRSFCPPTNKAVVDAWKTFAKRLVDVEEVDCDVEPETGDRRIWNTGWRDLVVWGASYRLRHEDLDDIEDAIDDAWSTVVKDYLGEPTFFMDREIRFVTREWNGLMDAIAHDESASPKVRQAAEDISIIAFGDQDGKDEYLELFKPADDEWLTRYHVTGWHKPEIFTTYPTTEHGVHVTSYRGWAADSWAGDDAIISAGGYVDGRYVSSSEVEQFGLWDRLSEDVRGEMAPLAGGDPADWNDKILELRGKVSPKDEELLDAMWISAEVFGGEVTVYGVDDDVTKMDHEDFEDLGLHRVGFDEDDEEEDEDAVDDR